MNCCHPTSDVASRQRLRSSSRHHLVVPYRCCTLGRQAFSVAGPMAWNVLPDDLRDPSLSADNFRKRLKTHLFRNALAHSALEALRNALYKFKTYLLTYLLTYHLETETSSLYSCMMIHSGVMSGEVFRQSQDIFFMS